MDYFIKKIFSVTGKARKKNTMKRYPVLTHAGYCRGTGGRHQGSYPAHSHNSGELVYVLRGRCSTSAVTQPTLDCPRWSLLITPPGLEHQQTDTPECDTLYIGFDTGDFEFDWSWRVLSFPEDWELYHLMLLLWQKFQQNSLTPECGALLEAILLYIRHREHHFEQFRFFHPAVKRAADFLEQAYRQSISLTDVAAVSGISVSRLNVLFRQQFQRSIGEYLMEKRLGLAKNLLHDPLYTINEVAEMSGFSSGNYFIRCFRKHFDTTPKQFRQNMERVEE